LGRVWAGHYGAYTTNGNICTPVMMIAEKAPTSSWGTTPLAPEPVQFYRHGAGMPLDPPAPARLGA
jgi:choline dehydrogenase